MRRPALRRPRRHLAADAPLTADPVEDDTWEDDRPDRGRRVRAGLVGALVMTCVFLGGVQAQKQWGSSGTGSALPAGLPAGLADSLAAGDLPAGLPGLPGGSGSGSSTSTASAGPAVIGTVTKVDGRTVTVTDVSGTEHVVELDDATKVTRSTKVPADRIETGASVTVTGTTDRGGRIAASGMTLR